MSNIFKKEAIKAYKFIKKGGVILYPTETIWGLGCDASNCQAVEKIYNIKKRPVNNPIICHFNSLNEIKKDFYLSELEELLAKKLWPGPITLILRKKTNSKISQLVSNKSSYIGCRIPKNKIALQLLKGLDFPVAAPPSQEICSDLFLSFKFCS